MSIITSEYKNIKIEPSDITSGEVLSKDYSGENRLYWEGLGVFDIFMKSIDENLRVQYDNGRIVGESYATAYIQLVSLALDKALQLASANAELKLKISEMEIKERQVEDELSLTPLKQENLRAQTKVYDRQVEGFSDNLKLKLMEAQLNAFAMIYSSGILDFDQNNEAFPSALKSQKLTQAYEDVRAAAILDWKATDKHSVEERIKRGKNPTTPIDL